MTGGGKISETAPETQTPGADRVREKIVIGVGLHEKDFQVPLPDLIRK